MTGRSVREKGGKEGIINLYKSNRICLPSFTSDLSLIFNGSSFLKFIREISNFTSHSHFKPKNSCGFLK